MMVRSLAVFLGIFIILGLKIGVSPSLPFSGPGEHPTLTLKPRSASYLGTETPVKIPPMH